jgi:RNA polymerase sigma-54 factor
MLEQGIKPDQIQKPRLTPTMILANELLVKPMMAFQQYLINEQAENPMIEEFEERTEWEDSGTEYRARRDSFDRGDSYDPLANLTAEDDSLQTYLIDQLRFMTLSDEEMAIGAHLVGCIDDSGHFEDDVDDVAARLKVSVPVVEAMLDRIKGLEPLGVGGRDSRECLMIQLQRMGEEGSLAMDLLREHWEDTRMLRSETLAKRLKRRPADVQNAIRRIGKLNPYPGRSVGSMPTIHIVPDIVVDLVNGRYKARLARQNMPRIRISDSYVSMIGETGGNTGDLEWMQKRVAEAKMLIRGIEIRGNTLLSVARYLVDTQEAFLSKGRGFLRPMKMEEVAKAIGVDTSTVSRAQSGKYIQTRQGIVPIKSFFTPEIRMRAGGTVSNTTVQDRLAELVRAEDPMHPLSDEKLACLLQGEGLAVKRRTVTKYRKILNILNTHERKRVSDLDSENH